ncbi:MAG: hypothetical protein IT381_25800 [Deltaproteobacteria bacterium]|nr:hypothetical protein [Deltaproteobacteria bacterium]
MIALLAVLVRGANARPHEKNGLLCPFKREMTRAMGSEVGLGQRPDDRLSVRRDGRYAAKADAESAHRLARLRSGR